MCSGTRTGIGICIGIMRRHLHLAVQLTLALHELALHQLHLHGVLRLRNVLRLDLVLQLHTGRRGLFEERTAR
jgi:hypothetical protein